MLNSLSHIVRPYLKEAVAEVVKDVARTKIEAIFPTNIFLKVL